MSTPALSASPPPLRLWMVAAAGTAIALLIPPLVYVACALLANMGLQDTLAALVQQYQQPRQNLLNVGLPVLLPVLGLVLALALLGRWPRLRMQRRAHAVAALLVLALLHLWTNASYWAMYLPERAFLGFPHGLEFIIVPLFFAPPAMAVAILIISLGGRRPRADSPPE